MVAFFLFLVQKLPHMLGQSSNICILVADFIVYLESHLLQKCTMRWGPSGKRQKNGLRWTSKVGHQKVSWDSECALERQSPSSFQNPRESTVGVGLWCIDWGCFNHRVKRTLNKRQSRSSLKYMNCGACTSFEREVYTLEESMDFH
jgi:hypothetical protein